MGEEIPEGLRQSLTRFNRRNDPRFRRTLEVTIHRFRTGYRQASEDEEHPAPASLTHNDYLKARTEQDYKRLIKAARTARGKKALAKKGGELRLAEAEQVAEAFNFRKHQTAQWRDAIQGLFIAWINGTGEMPAPDHTGTLRDPKEKPTGNTFNAFLLVVKDHLDPHSTDMALIVLAEHLLDELVIKKGQEGTIRCALKEKEEPDGCKGRRCQEGTIRCTLRNVLKKTLDNPALPRGPFFPYP